MKIIFIFIYLFILTTFITRTSGEAGVGIMGRITIADLFATVSIFLFMIYIFISKNKLKFPKILRVFYFLIFTFLLGIITSLNLKSTSLELIILLFLSFIFIVIVNTHKSEKDFLNLIFIVTIASFLASFTGIWDVMGFPRIFPRNAELQNLAVSGFRNTGQAGAYVLVMIAIMISTISSPLYKKYSRKKQLFFKISLTSSLIFLLLTIKIAAYIGLVVGMIFFLIKKRKMGTVYALLFFISILWVVFINLEILAPDLYNWMMYKTITKMENGTASGFIVNNLSNAIKAFSDNPLFGSSIGGFAGVYESHEIHSTYFKIIGETGLVGLVGYLVFMVVLYKMFSSKGRALKNNPYAQFLSNLQPFFIGFLVSWGYTYHIRKREFWILVAIIYLASMLSKKYQKEIGKS